ncbi:hypothetical protein PGT21_000669 [Puccinia graminis f. sp. tritici]|uniref:Uncharacterized protein n=1 Tax=Puccinia graminis f. sp. tritici TaxID=56615 RepID=A0A5B0PPC4_PUCGR|nr:hypothetical protein PGT21_000669 [Puccinia graminis f. sp. tritici]
MSFTGFETLTDADELLRRCLEQHHRGNQITIHASDSSENSSNSTTTNDPDYDLEIPGEPILCKAKLKGEYWPASLIGCVGLRNAKSRTSRLDPVSLSEKYYSVHFFDGTSAEVPRSFFLTSIERNFHTVPVGRIQTIETTYKQFLPKLIKILPDVDAILAGNASDSGVKQRHEDFLGGQRGQDCIPNEDIIYGKYSDSLLYEVAAFLSNRYSQNVRSDTFSGTL